MRGTVAKMLRRQVHSAPAELKQAYSSEGVPLTFRYPATSAQAVYKAIKRHYKDLASDLVDLIPVRSLKRHYHSAGH